MVLSLQNRKVYNPLDNNSPEIHSYLQKKGVLSVTPSSTTTTSQRSKNTNFNSPKGLPQKGFIFPARHGSSDGDSTIKSYRLELQEKEKSYLLSRKGSGGLDLKQTSSYIYQNQNTVDIYKTPTKQKTEDKRLPFDKYRASEPDIRASHYHTEYDSLGLRAYETSNSGSNGGASSAKFRKKLEITVDPLASTSSARTLKQSRPSSTKNADDKKGKLGEVTVKVVGQPTYSFGYADKLGGVFKSSAEKTGTKGAERLETTPGSQNEGNFYSKYLTQASETKISPRTKFIRNGINFSLVT